MFDSFSLGAIKTVMLAQQEALRNGHRYADTEHLLLGLLGEGKGIAYKSLIASGVDLKSARRRVTERIACRSNLVKLPWFLWWTCLIPSPDNRRGQFTFKPHAKRALELACEESKDMNKSFVHTSHLLLGIIREREADDDVLNIERSEGIAIEVLHDFNIDTNELRELILESMKDEK
ncbi:MAG TPA: Clp protease N-terminal domain-containing protein [Drouetiella sp.]|jgi:ATP-dependent Clp protease ATP-binding subunit ClpC